MREPLYQRLFQLRTTRRNEGEHRVAGEQLSGRGRQQRRPAPIGSVPLSRDPKFWVAMKSARVTRLKNGAWPDNRQPPSTRSARIRGGTGHARRRYRSNSAVCSPHPFTCPALVRQAAAAGVPQVLTFGHTKGGNRKLWVELR